MWNIFIVILGFVVMVLMLKYRAWIKDFVGDIGFAEKIFGIGGTHTFIILLAVLVFLGSLMYAMGTLNALLSQYVGPLFGR